MSDAVACLLMFLGVFNLLFTLCCLGILIHNKITLLKRVGNDNHLVSEIKEYFDKQKIRKTGF
jgi:hypothetical protein